jgi:hypothetical protein
VILLARTVGQLEESQVLLRERGVPAGRISIVPADLSDEVDRGCAAMAVLEAGRVDILVNNAATVEPRGPTIAIPAGEPRLALEVNVAAPAALAAAVLPGMLDARWGRVVNVSSAIAAYLAGVVGGNAYAATPRRPCSPTWPATTPGPSATLASPRCGPERQANAAGGGRVPRGHRQRPRNPDLLDGDDVHRPDGRIARQQLVGGLAERLGQGAGDVRLASVLAGEGIEDPVAGRIDPERVPGDCLFLSGRELAASPQELA